ncbi:MAG TPA: hypothetical protein VFD85_03690 [Gemmatimonadales bacterium]|nr:hypothetical protein [Gemmatimonadales bacterium]
MRGALGRGVGVALAVILAGSAHAQGVIEVEGGIALTGGTSALQAGVRVDGAKRDEVALVLAGATFPDAIRSGNFPVLLDIDLTYHVGIGTATLAVYGGVSTIAVSRGTGSGWNGGLGVLAGVGPGVGVRADFIVRQMSVTGSGLSGMSHASSLSLGVVLGR